MDGLPISKLRSRRREKKEARISAPAHVAWVRTLPCCITGSPIGVVAHHLLEGDAGAMGRKSGDNWVIPVVHHLHDYECPGSIHRIGEAAFAALHRRDLRRIASALWTESVAAGRARNR